MTYAQHASSEFNMELHRELTALTHAISSSLGNSLIALILGGGYGRGEGGVICVQEREYPYNDLDFTVVVTNKDPKIATELHRLSTPVAERLRIEIDFSRPLTITDIRHWPHWMMWHDLLFGHQVLYGPQDILTANAPTVVGTPLPLIEATRLLLNRGAGVLWALRIAAGMETAPDADFIRRNYYKCLLALGDALLITAQKYTTCYTGRDRLLESVIAQHPAYRNWEVFPQYQAALAFKFQPDHLPSATPSGASLQELALLWGKVWLAVEELRTKQTWSSLPDYCQWNGLREPEEHRGGKWLRNLAMNARRGRLTTVYPRETLYRRLPLLLQTPEDDAGWRDDSAAFLDVWRRFN